MYLCSYLTYFVYMNSDISHEYDPAMETYFCILSFLYNILQIGKSMQAQV